MEVRYLSIHYPTDILSHALVFSSLGNSPSYRNHNFSELRLNYESDF